MSSYTVQAGDTFSLISRKSYGTELNALLIEQANPGVVEPLQHGVTIFIPIDPEAPQDFAQSTVSDGPNEVSIFIRGKRFRYWSSVRIVRNLDTFDTVELVAPFEPDAPGFRESFRPFMFDPIEVNVGGAPLFTGTMVDVRPVTGQDGRTLTVSGYSLPGVLNDCNAPDDMPLEFNGQGLRDIATTMAKPFGVGVQFDDDQGSTFDRVAAGLSTKVLAFLQTLAMQRNLIISSTPRGKLLFQRSITDSFVVADFTQGTPLTAIVPAFSPQEYYSHIAAVQPDVLFLAGTKYSTFNPHSTGVLRPFSFQVPDTTAGDMESIVSNKFARMFANVASYSIEVPTWRDPQGDLWKPNTNVFIESPSAMIWSKFLFTIRSVDFASDKTNFSANMNLIIHGTLAGKVPQGLPWDASSNRFKALTNSDGTFELGEV